MKALLTAMTTLAFATASVANEMHNVTVKVRETKAGDDRYRVEAIAEFQEIALTLTLTSSEDQIEAIEVTVDDRKMNADIRKVSSASNLVVRKMSLQADCCIMGAAFYWNIPFGKAKRCWVTTREGRRERQLLHPEIFVRVFLDEPPTASVADPC